MTRVTKDDLSTALSRLRSALDYAGDYRQIPDGPRFTAKDLRMAVGSATYGRAYRTYYLDPTTGGHYQPNVPEYLGMTASEAYDTLRTLTTGVMVGARAVRNS